MDRLYRVSKAIGDDSLLRPNDILFVRSSLKQEGVGWAALFSGYEEPVTFCGFLIRARFTTDHISPEFLLSYLRLPPTRSLLIAQSGKVAITNISQKGLASLSIPVPGLSEQHEIAGVLRTCDAKIAALERESALLDELFRALLEELMTGRVAAVGVAVHE